MTDRHHFTAVILGVLENYVGEYAEEIFEASPLLGYLNSKTRSANRGSKSRGAFANHYALYVLIEDYVKKEFHTNKVGEPYAKYEGARFSDLLARQRELPFGDKLQNHALNGRLNDEFKKFYPTIDKSPIVRDVKSQRYWIQEDFLQVAIRQKDGKEHSYNLATSVLAIIDAYIATKMAAFEGFLEACRQVAELGKKDFRQASDFIVSQLQPNVDARIFEIVSYAVLKTRYGQETVWIGKTQESVVEETLRLHKTGRTNANDGGIDFVMRPLGRFFQVTETSDVKKYFLDIDKVRRFPVTFVVKSTENENQIRGAIRAQAVARYKIESVVDAYMKAVEEIINISGLMKAFDEVLRSGKLQEVMDEIVAQSKIEFHYHDDEDGAEAARA